LNLAAMLSIIALATACTSPDLSYSNSESIPLIKVDNQTHIQLIIKFSKPLVFPDIDQKLQEISKKTGITFFYIREMSGGAHVISTQHTLSDQKFSELLDSIRKRKDVEYVEIDTLMRHHQHLIKKGAVK